MFPDKEKVGISRVFYPDLKDIISVLHKKK
jgi:hypothetical protein